MEWFEDIFEIFDSAFLKKIEVKGGHGVKKWEFGKTKIFLKYQLFIRFNFVFMYYGRFPPKSSLKLRFVLFKPEKVSNAAGISNSGWVMTFSGFLGKNVYPNVFPILAALLTPNQCNTKKYSYANMI